MPLCADVVNLTQQAPLEHMDGIVIENAVMSLVTGRQVHDPVRRRLAT